MYTHCLSVVAFAPALKKDLLVLEEWLIHVNCRITFTPTMLVYSSDVMARLYFDMASMVSDVNNTSAKAIVIL